MKQVFKGLYVIVWIVLEVIVKACFMGILETLHIGSHEWHKEHCIQTLKGLRNAVLYAADGDPLSIDGQTKLNEVLDMIDSQINLMEMQ